jgi:hypothetical protein
MQVRKRRRQCFTHNSHAYRMIWIFPVWFSFESWMHELCLTGQRKDDFHCMKWFVSWLNEWMNESSRHNELNKQPFYGWLEGRRRILKQQDWSTTSWISLVGRIIWVSGNDAVPYSLRSSWLDRLDPIVGSFLSLRIWRCLFVWVVIYLLMKSRLNWKVVKDVKELIIKKQRYGFE